MDEVRDMPLGHGQCQAGQLIGLLLPGKDLRQVGIERLSGHSRRPGRVDRQRGAAIEDHVIRAGQERPLADGTEAAGQAGRAVGQRGIGRPVGPGLIVRPVR
jgi:hypothetical protein